MYVTTDGRGIRGNDMNDGEFLDAKAMAVSQPAVSCSHFPGIALDCSRCWSGLSEASRRSFELFSKWRYTSVSWPVSEPFNTKLPSVQAIGGLSWQTYWSWLYYTAASFPLNTLVSCFTLVALPVLHSAREKNGIISFSCSGFPQVFLLGQVQ